MEDAEGQPFAADISKQNIFEQKGWSPLPGDIGCGVEHALILLPQLSAAVGVGGCGGEGVSRGIQSHSSLQACR